MATRKLPFTRRAFNEVKRWWDLYPETFVSASVALLMIPPTLYFAVYREYWLKRRFVGFYKGNYTVWRPDDPRLNYQHVPADYPPVEVSVRENMRSSVNPRRDY